MDGARNLIAYYSSNDKEAVMAVLGNGGIKRPLMDWQFERCSNRRPIVSTKNGKLSGFNGIMPVNIWLDGKCVDAAWSCDFIVSPDCRRQGIGRQLKAALDADWPFLMALGISRVGQLALRTAGWVPFHGPKRYSRVLIGHDWRHRLVAEFQRATYLIMGKIRRKKLAPFTITRSDKLPAKKQVDSLLQAVIDDYDGCVIRDWDYLDWRYAQAPYHGYYFLHVYEETTLVGLGVVGETDSQLSFVDYLGPYGKSAIKIALVEYVISTAEKKERLNCTTSDKDLQRALLRSGFLPVRQGRIAFHVRDNRKAALPKPKHWFLMGGDSDSEMLAQARNCWAQLSISIWDDALFDQSEAEWDDLANRSNANPLFMKWQWQHTWWREFGLPNKHKLHIIAVRDRSMRLIALAPFYWRERSVYGVRTTRLEALGNLWQGPATMRSEYLEPLVDPHWLEPATTAIAESLATKPIFDDLVFSDVPLSSRNANQLLLTLQGKWSTRQLVRIREDETRFIVLPNEFGDYLSALGGNTRRRLFGRRKYLNDIGSVSRKYATSDSLSHYFELLNDFHVRRWGKPAFVGPTLTFHLTLAAHLLSKKQLRLSKISVDGRDVSVLYNAISGDREYNLQMGFDETFHGGKLSLGILHLGYAIEESIDNEIRIFDLLAGAGKTEHYKYRITNSGTQLCRWHVIRPRWLRSIYALRHAARQ